jgi:hypothetical protein
MFAASLHSTSSSVASLSPADVNHDLISTQKKRGAGKAWIISNTFPSRLLAEEVFAGDNWSHKRTNETMKGTVSDYQCTKHNCPYIHRIRSVLQGDITNPTRVYLVESIQSPNLGSQHDHAQAKVSKGLSDAQKEKVLFLWFIECIYIIC